MDLRHVRASDLAPVLDEEIEVWRAGLDWDFRSSAELVIRFMNLQALNGSALMYGGKAIGYSYFVYEEHKGLIGDLYVLEEYRTVERENRLLDAVLGALMHAPFVRRIECQLMMIPPDPRRRVPRSPFLQVFDRQFMLLELDRMPVRAMRTPPDQIVFQPWAERHQDACAYLITAAYATHIDSRINDQYRSAGGARRFLYNIIQYPGCGNFFQPGSFVAYDSESGRLSGLSLTSLVADDVGHITQICVSPSLRGMGVGSELLRRSLEALREYGCRKTGLTVTSSNHEAVRLYERVGFTIAKRFSAFVWEGF